MLTKLRVFDNVQKGVETCGNYSIKNGELVINEDSRLEISLAKKRGKPHSTSLLKSLRKHPEYPMMLEKELLEDVRKEIKVPRPISMFYVKNRVVITDHFSKAIVIDSNKRRLSRYNRRNGSGKLNYFRLGTIENIAFKPIILTKYDAEKFINKIDLYNAIEKSDGVDTKDITDIFSSAYDSSNHEIYTEEEVDAGVFNIIESHSSTSSGVKSSVASYKQEVSSSKSKNNRSTHGVNYIAYIINKVLKRDKYKDLKMWTDQSTLKHIIDPKTLNEYNPAFFLANYYVYKTYASLYRIKDVHNAIYSICRNYIPKEVYSFIFKAMGPFHSQNVINFVWKHLEELEYQYDIGNTSYALYKFIMENNPYYLKENLLDKIKQDKQFLIKLKPANFRIILNSVFDKYQPLQNKSDELEYQYMKDLITDNPSLSPTVLYNLIPEVRDYFIQSNIPDQILLHLGKLYAKYTTLPENKDKNQTELFNKYKYIREFLYRVVKTSIYTDATNKLYGKIEKEYKNYQSFEDFVNVLKPLTDHSFSKFLSTIDIMSDNLDIVDAYLVRDTSFRTEDGVLYKLYNSRLKTHKKYLKELDINGYDISKGSKTNVLLWVGNKNGKIKAVEVIARNRNSEKAAITIRTFDTTVSIKNRIKEHNKAVKALTEQCPDLIEYIAKERCNDYNNLKNSEEPDQELPF